MFKAERRNDLFGRCLRRKTAARTERVNTRTRQQPRSGASIGSVAGLKPMA
jgi:hypothetical protein